MMETMEVVELLRWLAVQKQIRLCAAHWHTPACKEVRDGIPWECGLIEGQYAPVTGYESLVIDYMASRRIPNGGTQVGPEPTDQRQP